MRLGNLWRRALVKLGLVEKHAAELGFWRDQIQVYIRWYEGKQSHRGLAPPRPEERVTGYGRAENAIRTWARLHGFKYPQALQVPADFFAGRKLLDVGCGPIPYALAFTDCEIWGLDQLIDEYRALGFPLDTYDPRLHYVCGAAEAMPFADGEFDAIISVNAIDHVDDLQATAREIIRVLRPDGLLRLQVHYHKPTTTEPWALSDADMAAAFAGLDVRRLSESPVPGKPEERFVIWGRGGPRPGPREG